MKQHLTVAVVALAAIGAAWLWPREQGEAQADEPTDRAERPRPAEVGSPAAAALPSPTSDTPASAPCAFELGDTHTYSVNTTSRFLVDPAAFLGVQPGPGQQRRQTIESKSGWTVTMRALTRLQGRPTIFALRFEGYSGSVNDEDVAGKLVGIDQPFIAEIDSRCRVRNVGRQPGVSDAALLAVQGALDTMMVVGPEQTDAAATYNGLHTDAMGKFVARYAWSPSERRLVRTKDHYLPATRVQGIPSNRDIRRSAREIEWGQGAFYSRLDGVEQMVERSKASGQTFSDVTETVLVESLEPRSNAFAGLTLKLSDFEWGRVDAMAVHPGGGDGGWKGRPIQELLSHFQAHMAAGNRQGMRLARAALVAYLRDNPEAAGVLAKRILDGEFSTLERALMMHALADAGTPQARQALVDLAYATELDENTRTQAAAALGDLSNPNVETIQKLATLGDDMDGLGSEKGLVNSAARMSIGNLVHDNAGNEELVAAGRQAIEKVLAAEDPRVLRQGLAAVGNTGDEHFLAVVGQALGSTDDATRAMAARALRRMDIEKTSKLVADRLVDEKHSGVIASLADAERVQVSEQTDGQPSEDSLNAYIAALWGSSNTTTRARIIELLGALVNRNPTARKALFDYFPREQDARLQKLIGRYIPGNELAGP